MFASVLLVRCLAFTRTQLHTPTHLHTHTYTHTHTHTLKAAATTNAIAATLPRPVPPCPNVPSVNHASALPHAGFGNVSLCLGHHLLCPFFSCFGHCLPCLGHCLPCLGSSLHTLCCTRLARSAGGLCTRFLSTLWQRCKSSRRSRGGARAASARVASARERASSELREASRRWCRVTSSAPSALDAGCGRPPQLPPACGQRMGLASRRESLCAAGEEVACTSTMHVDIMSGVRWACVLHLIAVTGGNQARLMRRSGAEVV